MFELYYFPGNASMAPHMLLEEVGAPFMLRLVDRKNLGQKAPDYMQLNPAGRIPTLVHGDQVLFESAAICLQIADLYPESNMAPAFGSDDRGQFYKWLMFLTNTVQPDILAYHYPEDHTDDADGTAAVRSRAQTRLGEWYSIIDEALSDGRSYLAGEAFSAVDYYLLMLCRWGRGLANPPRDLPHIGPLLERVVSRPAAQRALATEGLAAPIY